MVRKATRKYLKEQGTKVTKKDPKNMSASEKAQYKKLVKRMGVGVAAGILAGMAGAKGVKIGHTIYKSAQLRRLLQNPKLYTEAEKKAFKIKEHAAAFKKALKNNKIK